MPKPHPEPQPVDDLAAYVAQYSDAERDELAAADVAIDLAIMLYHLREHRGLTQEAAASRAGLQQQAVSRIERPQTNIRLDTLREYLSALGYTLELTVKEATSGDVVEQVTLPPLQRHALVH